MLSYLKIDNYALIEREELEFSPGFNVVTGESGAGKSILMGALEFLIGGRTDRGALRSGSSRCCVSGIFTLSAETAERVAALLEAAGVPFDAATGELALRRVMTSSATRNFIADTPVGGKLLAAVGAELIDFHGVNDQLSLLVPARQLELLDRFGRLEGRRQKCAELCAAIAALEKERAAFEANLPDDEAADRLRLMVEEIELCAPSPGEDEELAGKHRLASNSQQVLACAAELSQLLSEGENSVADQLGTVHHRLGELERIDSALVEKLLQKSMGIQDAAMELSHDIAALADKVDLDAEELAAIEARLEELYTLKRRYGPSLEQVLDALKEGRLRLRAADEAAQARKDFADKRKKLDAELETAARELSAGRRKHAEAFLAKCRAKLELIGFKGCRMEARFEDTAPGTTGMDKLEILFSANVGEDMRPLRKIASSGELSRVMLAMKTILADADAVPTVVFDEIDMNIGGETANRVGEELHALGKHRQILCISHLVQVAARADAHFLAEKHAEKGRTVSTVRRLDDVRDELARMLGGGESSLRHADALLRELADEHEST